MRIDKDNERETRIHFEIVADAHDAEERTMGWWNYLDDRLHLPFHARCLATRARSPLREGEIVTVTGIESEDEYLHEMFVTIQWRERNFAVPLAQLEGIDVDDDTAEAIADWHYWVARGYQL